MCQRLTDGTHSATMAKREPKVVAVTPSGVKLVKPPEHMSLDIDAYFEDLYTRVMSEAKVKPK